MRLLKSLTSKSVFPARSLRSETKDLLVEPRFRNSKFGGPSLFTESMLPGCGNALHSDVKNNTTNPTFRRQLKTELFRKYYR
jgi:hypothetical protein